ncbi:MAG: site-specific tyrosine recombinase XerD, partial [Gemmataceae bacterium]|nr:site-specific tyrosine recombinase XerD [Gemmataceae bacterium]
AEKYTVSSYGQAIARAVERANRPLIEAAVELELHVPHWHPNQLRHAHATEVRARFGLEAAQVALGHERADVTQVYAERNRTLAQKVAAEMG